MKKLLSIFAIILSSQSALAISPYTIIDMQRNSLNTATLAIPLDIPAGGASALKGVDGATSLDTLMVFGTEFSLLSGSPYKTLHINLPESQVTNLTTDLANLQPLNSKLTEYTALSIPNGSLLMRDGSGTLTATTVTAIGQSLMAASNSAAMKAVVFTGGNSSDVVLGDGSVVASSTFATNASLGSYLLSSSAVSTYEPIISVGTTAQYYRGDKTFQTLNKTAVGLPNVVNADTTTTANISDSTNKRFITDAQQIVLGNTSNTNTGDQTSVSGNAGTATALASNGTNCSAGSYPLGVDASGNVEGCTASTGGTITSVTGTANRITSTGGVAPQIDISSTFEALLGKVATGLSQFAATTSAQLRGVLSDETGTGFAYFQGGDIGTPSAGVATNITGTAAGLTAGNATKLAIARTLNGVSFDGTANVNLPIQAYEGITLRQNPFIIYKSATVASGTTSVNFTTDGTSGGTALCVNGIIKDSVNIFVNDATASYQMSYVFSNSDKTLTVTANKLTTANILTGVLGQGQANSSVLKISAMCY